jgi:hypothetical protein
MCRDKAASLQLFSRKSGPRGNGTPILLAVSRAKDDFNIISLAWLRKRKLALRGNGTKKDRTVQ